MMRKHDKKIIMTQKQGKIYPYNYNNTEIEKKKEKLIKYYHLVFRIPSEEK